MTAMTAYRPGLDVQDCKLKQNDNDGCNSCAILARLVLSFIACFILLVIAPLGYGASWGVKRVNLIGGCKEGALNIRSLGSHVLCMGALERHCSLRASSVPSTDRQQVMWPLSLLQQFQLMRLSVRAKTTVPLILGAVHGEETRTSELSRSWVESVRQVLSHSNRTNGTSLLMNTIRSVT